MSNFITFSLSALPPKEKASSLCQYIYKTFTSEQDPKGFIPFPTVHIFRYCVGYMGFPSVLLLKDQNHSPLWYADWKTMQSWPKLQVDLWPFPTDGKTQTKWMQWNQLLPKDSAFLSPLNPFLLSGCQSLWVFSFPSWTATEESLSGLAVHASCSHLRSPNRSKTFRKRCAAHLLLLCSQRKSSPCFHQRSVHGHLPPEESTLRYDPIFGVISDQFHLLLRKWRMITSPVFKPNIFSSWLSQAHFLSPYNFRFAHSRCFSTLTSPTCPTPVAVHDRSICFSRG